MIRWNVIVAALEGHAALADAIAQRLSSAWHGGGATAPTMTTIGAAELQPDSLGSIDAVVLVGDRNVPPSPTLASLNLLEEAGVPVLALLDELPEPGNVYEFAGALIEKCTVDDQRLVSLLRGVLHRQQEVKRLRAEVALSQRFHGGLKGEIARMHEELQLAALVQREFLPRENPAMHGIEFAALWRPTNYVSGDIYDLIRLDEDHVGVFVADAVGHGVPAALMTMVICRSLSPKDITGNSYRIVPPAEVLGRLNAEMIRRQGRTTRFATAVYAVIDCRSRVMHLAGAGHPPPMRLSRQGVSSPLETVGGLLGVFPDEEYTQIEVQLDADDRVLFYTDGFEQAFPNIAQGETNHRMPSTRYRTEFGQLHRLETASEMVEAISRRLDDQIGSLHQIDDLTMVCMRIGALNQMPPVVHPETGVGHEPQSRELRLAL
jgi:phosphoserine phosphatase RsbU/P